MLPFTSFFPTSSTSSFRFQLDSDLTTTTPKAIGLGKPICQASCRVGAAAFPSAFFFPTTSTSSFRLHPLLLSDHLNFFFFRLQLDFGSVSLTPKAGWDWQPFLSGVVWSRSGFSVPADILGICCIKDFLGLAPRAFCRYQTFCPGYFRSSDYATTGPRASRVWHPVHVSIRWSRS